MIGGQKRAFSTGVASFGGGVMMVQVEWAVAVVPVRCNADIGCSKPK